MDVSFKIKCERLKITYTGTGEINDIVKYCKISNFWWKITVIFEVPDFEFKPSVDRVNQVEFDTYK
jgi:hypothetical protein